MIVIKKVIQFLTFLPYHFFLKSFEDPKERQTKCLEKILKLARPHDEFSSVSQFQETYPIATYEQYLATKSAYLNKIIFYESTSGTSSAKKEIPYTKELLRSFSKMFSLWVYDLLTYGPQLLSGRLYFSVTPQFTDQSSSKLTDDSDYISGPLKYIFNFFSITPGKLKQVDNPTEFYHILCLYILRNPKLEIISIWSPTFLLEIIRYIEDNQERLLQDIEKPIYSYKLLTFKLPKIATSQLILYREKGLKHNLFSQLKLISCWGGAHAKSALDQLRKLLPHTFIQEKGYLATEAPFTLPSLKTKTQLPLIDEVFFEFRSRKNPTKIHLIHELVVGEIYEVIISQKSGLLRYVMNDLIIVEKCYRNTPCFSFYGRSKAISDLVGEKLESTFVLNALNTHDPDTAKSLLPVKDTKKSAYYLLLSEKHLNLEPIEEELKKNPHYANARALNQLSALKSLVIPQLTQTLAEFYAFKRGISLGDQKHKSIHYTETNGELLEFLRDKAITE